VDDTPPRLHKSIAKLEFEGNASPKYRRNIGMLRTPSMNGPERSSLINVITGLLMQKFKKQYR
jgi:hypothetical protein